MKTLFAISCTEWCTYSICHTFTVQRSKVTVVPCSMFQVLGDLVHWEWLWDLSTTWCLCEEQVFYMLSPICCSGKPGNWCIVDLPWRGILQKMSQLCCTVPAIPGSNTACQHTNDSLIAPVTRQEPQDFLWHGRHPESVCSSSVALHASLFVTKVLIFRGEQSFMCAPSLHVYKPGISARVKVNQDVKTN